MKKRVLLFKFLFSVLISVGIFLVLGICKEKSELELFLQKNKGIIKNVNLYGETSMVREMVMHVNMIKRSTDRDAIKLAENEVLEYGPNDKITTMQELIESSEETINEIRLYWEGVEQKLPKNSVWYYVELDLHEKGVSVEGIIVLHKGYVFHDELTVLSEAANGNYKEVDFGRKYFFKHNHMRTNP